MKVLLIDDQEDVRRIVSLSLSRIGGLTVVEAPDGEAGVTRARQEAPDAILLDAVMPGLDGRDTLAALLADPRTRGIPVVVLSASDGEAAELVRLGAVGRIAKPIDPLSFPASLQEVLARAGAGKA
ncbi:response regulator [Acidobacteria bacterium ACD]|nr:MAG: response regulator [Acidobacteriota bacterium]MCE7957729.1 response regulator [Acidobacteria bacterium ACB2]MDL1949026.1 response regulator [Acidobacteria bacterium ACD]